LKKIFSLVFLIIVLFNVVGYFIVFKVEQFQVKSEIKSAIRAGLSTEALVIINIDKSDAGSIEWMEFGEEFRFKDNLYDVVKYTETKKTITYYCINDSREESLFSNLTEHINIHVATNNAQKDSKKLNKHVIKLYFLTVQQSVLPATCMFINLPPKTIIFASATIKKLIPPPPELV
jgi:uncharacterized protein (UPF0333 family)